MTEQGFYGSPGQPLRQGDLVIAPLLRAVSATDPAPDDSLRRSPDLQRFELATLPHKSASAEAVVNVTLGMVVSHDCYVDKAFNREVDRLRRGGARKAEAEQIAEADDRLDRWIVVSPVVQPDAVSADLAAIERAEAVGLVVVPASTKRGINQPGVVDLGLRFSTDRKLCTRVATISQEGADGVRMAMLRLDLARTGGFADLEALVGAKLADVEVDERHPLKVRLRFGDGQQLTVTAAPQAGGTQGSGRTSQSAP